MIMTQKNFAVSVLIMLLALCIGTPVRAEKGWIDVTDKYLKNPGFDGNSNAYWTYTSDAHSQTVRCEAMEFWNGTWDLYQVISNLPAGEYRMTVQAYYRCMDNDPGYQNYQNGTEDITGVMNEGWHFRYVGEEAARYIMDNDLTLEEFWDLFGENA